MAVFKSFMAVRPTNENADKVAALPYDVMNSQEAREMVKGKKSHFIRSGCFAFLRFRRRQCADCGFKKFLF